MAKKESTTTKKKGVAKKSVKKEASKKDVTMKVSKNASSEKKLKSKVESTMKSTTSKFSTFFGEFKDNISEGAKALKNISADLLEDVKEKAEDFYGKGAEKFEQASGVVENYVDRYNGEKEIKQLSKEKEELNTILGSIIYHEFKKNGTISKRFLTTKKSTELISSIESIDKRILQLGKELDRK